MMGFDPVSYAMGAKSGGGSSGGGVLVVHADADTGALDKTWQEIHDADFAVVIFAINEYDTETGIVVATLTSRYRVQIAAFTYDDPVYIMTASTDSASGYPVVSFDDDDPPDDDPPGEGPIK